MSLKLKLLIPFSAVFLTIFTIFIFYLVTDQYSKDDKDLKLKIENMSELIAMTNLANLWNFDQNAIEQNINSFLKDRDIVSITIKDTKDIAVAKAEKRQKHPKMITKTIDIIRDGNKIGSAKIVFTNYYGNLDVTLIGIKFIAAGIIMFFVISFILIILANYITSPIVKLMNIVKNISEGDGDLSLKINVTSKDEVGKLSNYINIFIEKLKNIVINLRSVGSKSKELGTILTTNTQEISASTEEISSTMNSMSERINKIYNEIEKSNININKTNGYIENVIKLIENQAASVNESSAAIEEMISNVNSIEASTENKKELTRKLVELSKDGESIMNNNVNAMEEISKSTETIFEMIKVINDVAEQTDLLAMNAAIEAAHAGESGKGFSVVADEIRKLAEKTGINAKTISGSLKQIIDMIKNTSGITKDANRIITEVMKGIVDVSGSMTETLAGLKEISIGNKQITESLTELNKLTEEVRVSGIEMDKETTQIEDSIKYIYEIANENKNGISETAGGVNEISNAMNRLAELSNDNFSNIELLDRELSKFKT